MSTVFLKDGTSFFLPAEVAAKLAEARNAGARLIDVRDYKVGMEFVDPTFVGKIVPGGTDPNQKTLPPPERPRLTEAQLAANRERITRMKADFIKRPHKLKHISTT